MTAAELLEQCRAVVPGEWEAREYRVWHAANLVTDETMLTVRMMRSGIGGRYDYGFGTAGLTVDVVRPTIAEAIHAVRRRLAPEDPWPWPEPQPERCEDYAMSTLDPDSPLSEVEV